MVGPDGSFRNTLAEVLSFGTSNTIYLPNPANKGNSFAKYQKQIAHYLANGYSVIVDAPNLTVSTRVPYFKLAKDYGCRIRAHVAAEHIERCIKRYPDKKEEIWSQVSKFQVPTIAEGFDSVFLTCYHSVPNENFLRETYKKMSELHLHNDYHNHFLNDHCKNAAALFEKYDYAPQYNLGARLHDIGKLFTETVDEDGKTHHYSHENVGAYYLLCHLDDIKASTNFTDDKVLDMVFLVNYHMLPLSWQSERSFNKWKSRFPEDKIRLIQNFNECDKSRVLDEVMNPPMKMQ